MDVYVKCISPKNAINDIIFLIPPVVLESRKEGWKGGIRKERREEEGRKGGRKEGNEGGRKVGGRKEREKEGGRKGRKE